MRISKSSWDQQAFRGWDLDDDDEEDQASPAKGAGLTLLGLIVALGAHGMILFGIINVLHEQGALSWKLEWYQGIAFAAGYLILRAMNRVMYPPLSNSDE